MIDWSWLLFIFIDVRCCVPYVGWGPFFFLGHLFIFLQLQRCIAEGHAKWRYEWPVGRLCDTKKEQPTNKQYPRVCFCLPLSPWAKKKEATPNRCHNERGRIRIWFSLVVLTHLPCTLCTLKLSEGEGEWDEKSLSSYFFTVHLVKLKWKKRELKRTTPILTQSLTRVDISIYAKWGDWEREIERERRKQCGHGILRALSRRLFGMRSTVLSTSLLGLGQAQRWLAGCPFVFLSDVQAMCLYERMCVLSLLS